MRLQPDSDYHWISLIIFAMPVILSGFKFYHSLSYKKKSISKIRILDNCLKNCSAMHKQKKSLQRNKMENAPFWSYFSEPPR